MLKGRRVLSLTTTETKSFGPVPASDLITIVMPKAKIKQPSASVRILQGRAAEPIIDGRQLHRYLGG